MGGGVPETSDGPQGRCVQRVPNKPVARTPDGRIALHLWLRQDRRFDGDLTLRLSPAEAEVLHAQLCYVLDDTPPTSGVAPKPTCRAVEPPPAGSRA